MAAIRKIISTPTSIKSSLAKNQKTRYYRAMVYEHHTQPVITHRQWLLRMARSVWCSAVIVAIALLIGVLGYHTLGHLAWVDAFLEASMILGGMGPVAPLTNDAIKIFAALYALFSGLVLLSTMGILLTPLMHRILHTHMQKKK